MVNFRVVMFCDTLLDTWYNLLFTLLWSKPRRNSWGGEIVCFTRSLSVPTMYMQQGRFYLRQSYAGQRVVIACCPGVSYMAISTKVSEMNNHRVCATEIFATWGHGHSWSAESTLGNPNTKMQMTRFGHNRVVAQMREMENFIFSCLWGFLENFLKNFGEIVFCGKKKILNEFLSISDQKRKRSFEATMAF